MLKMLDCKHWDVTMGSNNFFRKVIYYISYAPTMQIFTMSLRKSHENVSYGTTKLNLQRLKSDCECVQPNASQKLLPMPSSLVFFTQQLGFRVPLDQDYQLAKPKAKSKLLIQFEFALCLRTTL